MGIILVIYLLKNKNHYLFLQHQILIVHTSYYIDNMKNKK